MNTELYTSDPIYWYCYKVLSFSFLPFRPNLQLNLPHFDIAFFMLMRNQAPLPTNLPELTRSGSQ